MQFRYFLFAWLIFGFSACGVFQRQAGTPEEPDRYFEEALPVPPPSTDDGRIAFQILHINDVYEIAPLPGDDLGGFARLKTLFDSLYNENPNTLFVVAGDFLSPSLLSSLKVDGTRIAGRHMIEVMNYAGVDVVAFGNHEFDLEYEELQQRLDESEFEWLATNVLRRKGDRLVPFHARYGEFDYYLPETYIWEISDADGTQLTIGIFSALLPANQKDYVYYEDVYDEALKAYLELNARCDLVLGLTHLDLEMDLELAALLPHVPLIMGGHEHELHHDSVGNVHIFKADANAKTAWIHQFEVDKALIPDYVGRKSYLRRIDRTLPADPYVDEVVQKWLHIQQAVIRQAGIDPERVLLVADEPLDGREASVRNHPTNLTRLITAAMVAAARQPVDAAILNGGAIRVDDQLRGPLTGVDVFRTLPFGGSLVEVDLKGRLLRRVLEQGLQNKGKGGYLHWEGITYRDGQWRIGDAPLEDEQVYHLILPAFLLTGRETGLDFFTRTHPDILSVDAPAESEDVRADIRKAVVRYLLSVKE